MADDGSSSEKTEDATPRRLREAREKGQIAKSQDMNTVFVLIAAFVGIWVTAGYMMDQFKQAMQMSFEVVSRHDLSVEDLVHYSSINFIQYIKATVPCVGIITLAALLVNFVQVGPLITGEPLKPQMKRLNIVENVKNMFKMTTFIELIKNIAKIALVFIIAYTVIKSSLGLILSTVTVGLQEFMIVLAEITEKFLIRVMTFFVVIAIIDVFVQRHQHHKQLRMSKDEVKREYKQDEGDPHMKGHRRQLHQELAMSDVKQAVGASDAIITNPTELAIAVKYDEKSMMAPQIMAKGQRLFAQMIREVAEENQIPIVRNIPLAWSLIELEVGDEIPEDLYAAVAEVLVFVYRMKRGEPGDGL